MAFTLNAPNDAPLAELNTTPLIDVMLVLLVMIILSIPVASHELAIDLPSPSVAPPSTPLLHDRNKVSVTPSGAITFNGSIVTAGQLQTLLEASLTIRPEPELQFQPDPQAPYDAAAKVLRQIKASGLTAFGFVGNENHAQFGKAAAQP